MSVKKKGINEKIHSVKKWLEKAEDSYDNASKARGELNLIMAKAEMQHLEENNKPFLKGYTLLGIPFLFFTIAIFAMSFWIKDSPADVKNISQPSPIQTSMKWQKEIEHKPLFETELKFDLEQTNQLNEKTQTVALPNTNENFSHEGREVKSKVIMNANDLKRTVYEANKSLRGE